MSQIQEQMGNEEDYFDSSIHKFKKATSTSVFTITIAALNYRSPKTCTLEYFNGIL
ncbi:hypothetical protein LXA43DRAFT_1092158 [Ganoderma leucocontextum]|nr:hypothetical protein LXA43DRAFT_1092158 [Ganoderma leucocontextum]